MPSPRNCWMNPPSASSTWTRWFHPVGDVHVAVTVHGEAGRSIKFAFAAAGGSELGYELAVGGEFLDAIIAPVGDVEVAVRRLGYAPGEVELAVSVSELAPTWR